MHGVGGLPDNGRTDRVSSYEGQLHQGGPLWQGPQQDLRGQSVSGEDFDHDNMKEEEKHKFTVLFLLYTSCNLCKYVHGLKHTMYAYPHTHPHTCTRTCIYMYCKSSNYSAALMLAPSGNG